MKSRAETMKVVTIISGLFRIDAISAPLQARLVREYRENGDVDALINGLWSDFNSDRVAEIEEAVNKLEQLK